MLVNRILCGFKRSGGTHRHDLADDATSSARNMEEFGNITLMLEPEKIAQIRAQVVRNQLSMEQRIEVLRRYSSNQDINSLAAAYNCGRRQIKNILRKRKKYLTMWAQMNHGKRTKHQENDSLSTSYDAVGFVLNEWVERARSYQINITDEILKSFGQEIADVIEFKEFNQSYGWLQSFKQKYGLTESTLKVKQGQLPSLQERKPLSISKIIADLRREHGESSVPMGSNNRLCSLASDEIYLAEDDSTNVPETSPSENGDSAICMQDNRMNIESESGIVAAKEIESYRDALNQLGPLEQFALVKENIRAVGLINQLENLFRELMLKEENLL